MIRKFQNPSGKLTYEEALRQAGERVEKERKDYLTTSNDNTWVERRNGKQKNKHLKKRGIKGAKSHALWKQEHPVLNVAGTVASAAPLAVAAYPLVAGAGELAYGLGTKAAATTVGQTLLPWIDAGLTSYFGAHGLNHAINEGIDDWGDAAMTALEVAPLGRLVKPLYDGVVQPGMRLFNSPLTGNWTKIGNREYRLSPNSLGMNRVSVESKPVRNVRLYRATGTNGNFEASLDGGQEFAGQWFTDNPTKPQRYASMTVKRAKRAGIDNPIELQYVDIPESELSKYRASEILKGRTDIEYEPTEDFLIPLDYPRQRVPLEGYTGNYLQDARRPLPELDIKSTTPQITAENAASITPEQWTAAQDAAIARGDMTEAQRLRDLHADVKGYNSSLPLYHGSPEKNITAFDPNAKAGTLEGSGGTTFFTPNFEAADTYAKGKGVFEMTHDPGKVYKVYSAHKNPKIIDYDGASYRGTGTKLTMNAGDGIMRRILNPKGGGHFLDDYTVYTYDKLPIEGLEYPRYYAPPRNKHIVWEKEKVAGSTSEEAAKAMSEGYDVAILKNVDEGVGPNSAKIGPIDDYAIRDPRLIKSADAVTYDDNGVRIPLGERDNFGINDIRYGLIPFGTGLTGYGLYNLFNQPQQRLQHYKQGGKMIYKFKKGNKIHIKKANRGKFTDYCGGKVTNECIQRGKNSSDPAVRKRATFAANARKWNHKNGGVIVAEGGIKLGNILGKAQNFLNSDLGKNVVSGIGNLYSGIKQSNELKKQEDQLKRDYNYISKQVNTQDIINQTNQQFQELQSQNPDIHYSEIDWRNLYGKNEGIAKQKAQANARNYLANARLLQQNTESSGNGFDLSGLVNTGMQLLSSGNKNKTNTTTTNTQIPSTATPTYFSSGFDWSKPTLASAIKFST